MKAPHQQLQSPASHRGDRQNPYRRKFHAFLFACLCGLFGTYTGCSQSTSVPQEHSLQDAAQEAQATEPSEGDVADLKPLEGSGDAQTTEHGSHRETPQDASPPTPCTEPKQGCVCTVTQGLCLQSVPYTDDGSGNFSQCKVPICNGRCTELHQNSAHCGACNNTCQDGELCQSGQCKAFCLPNNTVLALGYGEARFTGPSFSPDGRWLSATTSSGRSSVLRLWDAQTGKALETLSVGGTWSADSKMLLSCRNKSFQITHLRPDGTFQTTTIAQQTQTNLYCSGASWLPGNKQILVIGRQLPRNNTLEAQIWERSTGRLSRRFSLARECHTKTVGTEFGPTTYTCEYKVLLHPDGKLLAVASYYDKWSPFNAQQRAEGEVALWDLTTGKRIAAQNPGHTGEFHVVFQRKGILLATGAQEGGITGNVALWKYSNNKLMLSHYLDQRESVASLAFSPGDKLLAVGGEDGTVTLWEVDTNTKRMDLSEKLHSSTGLAFRPDGKALAIAHHNQMRLVELPTGKSVAAFQGVSHVVAHPTQPRVLAYHGEGGNSMQLWDLSQGIQTKVFALPFYGVSQASFSADGHTLVVTPARRQYEKVQAMIAFDAQNAQQFATYTTESDIRQFLVNRDASRIALLLAEEKTVKRWNPRTQKELAPLPHDSVVSLASLHEATGVLATVTQPSEDGKEGGVITLWALQHGKKLHTLPKRQTNVWREPVFSADGSMLLIISELSNDPKLSVPHVWDVSTGTLLYTLGTENTLAMQIHPNRPALATTHRKSNTGSVVLWDLTSGKTLRTFTGQLDYDALAFHPQGHTLASTDTKLRLWDIYTGKLRGSLLPGSFLRYAYDGTGDYIIELKDGFARVLGCLAP